MIQQANAQVTSAAPSPARAAATEEQMRSAFLFQLAQYVTWPAPTRPGEPLRFCVAGDDDLAEHLDKTLKGKTIQGRTVTASRVSGAEQIAACQVAFLSLSKKSLQQLLARWTYPPVLLVGDADGFASRGGMVNIRIDAGRLALEINLVNCRRAGLDMRSQLLRLARIVPGEGTLP